MSDVTDADRDKALQITGCELDPHPGGPFCRAHDEDGNPPWDRCRWVPVAYALADERRKARAPFLALADDLEGEYLPMSPAQGQAFDIAARIRRAAEDPA